MTTKGNHGCVVVTDLRTGGNMENVIRASFSRQFRYIAIGLLGLFLAACETIPVEQFNAYRESVRVAREAAQEVMVSFEADASYLQDRIAATKAPEISKRNRFVAPPPLETQRTQNLTLRDHMMVRTRLWEALGAYNEALAFLAEGRSVEQLKKSFGGLTSAFSGLLTAAGVSNPVIAPIGGLIVGMAEQVEKARSRAHFREIATGPGHEIVKVVLTALRADAVTVDRAARLAAIGYLMTLKDETSFGPNTEIAALVGPIAIASRPSDVIRQLNRAVALYNEMDQMIVALDAQGMASADPVSSKDIFPESKGAGATVAQVLPSQVTQFVDEIEQKHGQAEAIFKGYSTKYAALAEYDRLISEIEVAANALAQPEIYRMDPAASAAEIATSALTLRRLFRAVEAARD